MTTEENDTIIDTSESQVTPEPAEASAPEETKASAEQPKRKRGHQTASSNGNGHRPATEQESALALAESVEGQFETVRSNALDALGTLRKQRDILDESIQSLEGIVERYAGPGEVTEPAKSPNLRAAAPKPPAKRGPRKDSARAPKRTKADMQASCDKIVALLQKKGAMKTESIREALDISKPVWLTTAKHLKADKRVKVSGERRSTTFAARG